LDQEPVRSQEHELARASLSSIGESVKRVEDLALLTGRATYAADIRLPGQLTAYVVRSPVAHGRIIEIDRGEAEQLPGVVAIWTADDLKSDLGTIPSIRPRLSFDESVVPYLQPVLASERVRYVGEPIAMIVAGDRYSAEDAADLVFADIDPLPPVLSCCSARDGEPLFDAGNEVTVLRAQFGDESVFESAPIVVEAELETQRHSGVPMETRGLVVEFKPETDSLVVHGSTKVPHANRAELCRQLGIAPQRIRMIETSVGGGFGVRGEFYPEDFLLAWAALRLRRSVGWVEDRREHFIATNQARQQFHRAALAGDRDGRILGLRSEFWADMGAYIRTHGIRVPDLTLSMLPGPYDIATYKGIAHCVVTNKTPTATYRCPGRFSSCFVRERLIDMYAARVGMKPIDVRRRNLIRPEQMPFRRALASTGEPVILNEGDYPKMLDRVVERIDLDEITRRRSGGERVGAGVAMFLEKSGLGPWEAGSVRITPDGTISVRSGCSSVGQGLRTVLAQIVAETFDVDLEQVRVELLDTDFTPVGTGSYASRSTVTAGNAVYMAAKQIVERAKECAAAEFEVDPADLVVRAGGLEVRGASGLRITLTEIMEKLGSLVVDASGSSGLAADDVFHVEKLTYPYGCHAAVVVVDGETGAPRVEKLVLGYDVGRAVNPMLVEGQLHGGAMQGLGGALLERFVFDDDGNPLVTSFMDYLMPTSSEAPVIETIVTEDAPTATNPLGLKGAGEGGLTGVAAAIASAIDDALGRSVVRRLPVEPSLLASVGA
jgi:aerobic carbon-monoxide dehydrogenase large subunit